MPLPSLRGSPWDWPDWTADELHAVVAAYPDNRPQDPLHQYQAVRRVNAQRPAVERGDGLAIMQCIRTCAAHDLLMPAWLFQAFDLRIAAVTGRQVDSWDHPRALGKPFPNQRLHAARMERLYGFRVRTFFDLQGWPRTPAGRKKAAEVFGLTEKQVRKLAGTTRTNQRGPLPFGPDELADLEQAWNPGKTKKNP